MPHYFEDEPAAPSAPTTVGVRLPDVHLDLVADRGVFSRSALDPGTKLLLLAAPAPPDRGEVLDLGCGWGPIAVTLARRAPAARIWAVDVNRRALALTEENARRAETGNIVTARPDDVPDDLRFTAVYSNPPVRIGKAALHDLLRTWIARLDGGGAAHLVVQRNLGADSLARWLGEEGWTVERTAAKAGYRLLRVTR